MSDLQRVDPYRVALEIVDDAITRAEPSEVAALKDVRDLLAESQARRDQPSGLALHEHHWVKVSEQVTGMTQTRTYECPECNTHTTMVGPYGVASPFDVEEVDHATSTTQDS